MTGEKGGLLAGLRAEALKSRHAAPVRLAVLMALPMPLLGAMPYRGVQIFSAWNYWYALFLPVALSLVVACVARADARTRMRGLLGLGFPLGRAWWAKALARQQPLGRRGGHHRGPPVRGLTNQAPHTGIPRNQKLPG